LGIRVTVGWGWLGFAFLLISVLPKDLATRIALIPLLYSRLDQFGIVLSMHKKTFDLGRETERCERGKTAPVLDVLEPEAI
jgi:hypothetical protein